MTTNDRPDAVHSKAPEGPGTSLGSANPKLTLHAAPPIVAASADMAAGNPRRASNDPAGAGGGFATLTLKGIDQMTLISPFRGQHGAVAAALTEAYGIAPGDPGGMTSNGSVHLQWFGHETWMLIGAPAPDLSGLAATVDQGDGWAVFDLLGPAGDDVLARLVPVDLRAGTFGTGRCLRSELDKLPCAIARHGGDHLRIMVFRSMAGSAQTKITAAITAVAAR